MDYQEFPRYVRFVNTSAYIVPPFAIMKVVGVNSDGDLEIDRPTVDNDNSGIICNLATPVEAGAKGIAQLNEPFTMGSVGMGPPPSAGEVWGVKKDTWELCRDRVGFRIMAVGDANYVVACRMEGQYFQRVIVTGAAASGFYPATEQRYNSANDTWVSYDTVLLRSDESFSVNGTVYAQRVSHNGTYPIFLPLSITSSESSTTTVTTEPSVEPPVPMELEGNNGSAYGWVEKYQLSNGTMTDKVGGRTGNLTLHTLYEVNGVSGLENGTIVFGFPGYGWDTEAVVGINQTGNGTLPHIHSLYISNETTGGNYTLSYTTNGTTYEETAPIDWDANATVLETALEALAGIGDLTITGDGNITSPFLIEHPANGSQYSLVPDSTNLTGAQLWIFEYQGESGGGSEGTEIVELASRANGDYGVGWTGNVSVYGPSGYVNSGETVFVYQPDQRSPLFKKRRVIAQRSNQTDSNLTLPVSIAQTGAEVAAIRVASYNDPFWLGTIVRYPSPAPATTDGFLHADNWLPEHNATCIILAPAATTGREMAFDVNQTLMGLCVSHNGTYPIYKVIDYYPFYLTFGYRDDEVPFNQTKWLHTLDQYVYVRRIRLRRASTGFTNDATMNVTITAAGSGSTLTLTLNGTSPTSSVLNMPTFGGNYPSFNGQLNANDSISIEVVVNNNGSDSNLGRGVNLQLEIIPRYT